MLTDIWAMLLHINLLLILMIIVQLLILVRRRNGWRQPTRLHEARLLVPLLELFLFLMLMLVLLLDLRLDLMPLVRCGLHILLVKLEAKLIALGNQRSSNSLLLAAHLIPRFLF